MVTAQPNETCNATEQAIKHLAELPCAPSDDYVTNFLATVPLPVLFRELTAPHATSAANEQGVAALRKVFDTAAGAALLPEVLPYANAALSSQASTPPPLRRLGVQLAGRLACAVSGPGASEQSAAAAELLLSAVGDEDVGVSLEAERALKSLAATPAGLDDLLRQQGGRLQALASSVDPTLRARALTLMVALASASPAAADAVRGYGLLAQLQAELSQPEDLLACMAALQLVGGAAHQCDASMAEQLQTEVGPALAGLLVAQEPLLRCAAMQAAAELVATSLQRCPVAMDSEGTGAAPAATANGHGAPAAAAGVAQSSLAQALLAALKAALDISSSEAVPPEVEEAALDAVATLGHTEAAARALLLAPTSVIGDMTYKALGRPSSPAVRMGALHALAAVAGVERAAAAGGSRAAALLPSAAEAALRVAVYEGATAGGAHTPAAAFLTQLEQPFLEHRVASYRALSALLLRDYAAADVCSNAALLDLLLNPQTETGLQGCEWRYACVAALAATIRAETAGAAIGGGAAAANGVGTHHAVLSAALPGVDAAARQGPFGQGLAAPAVHQVATQPGL